jgi:hypothetical protein
MLEVTITSTAHVECLLPTFVESELSRARAILDYRYRGLELHLSLGLSVPVKTTE